MTCPELGRAIPSGLLLVLFCAGCYPVHKTLQRPSQVRVVDEHGSPVAGAEVHLITSGHPYGHERDRATRVTDEDGRAAFERKAEWRVESLMIHGAEVLFWNWCVRLEGHATVATTDRTAEAFDPRPEIVLRPGRSSPCGDPLERGWEPAEVAFGGHPPGTVLPCSFLPVESAERPEPEIETREECATFDAEARPEIDAAILRDAWFGDELAEIWIDGAWYYVRPTGESLRVVSWDNGPDPFSEGLVRVDRIERVAYANRDFNEVIGPRFTWGWPFEDGFAITCIDCTLEEPDADGHRAVNGGRWGAVDPSGRAVVLFNLSSYGEVRRAIDERYRR